MDATVLVTGAATGLGRACADRLSAEGYAVVGWDVRGVDSNARVDVSAFDDVSTAAALLPPLVGVVHCAGVTSRESIMDSDPEEWARVIAVNLLGTFHVARAAYPLLRGARGTFVAVGSVQGTSGFRNRSAYGASKAAVVSLVRSMAVEWGQSGVRAVCVSPGYTTFGMSSGTRMPPEVYRRIPSGELVGVSEVTEVVAFLLSPRAGALTGIEIPVDNGFTAFSGI